MKARYRLTWTALVLALVAAIGCSVAPQAAYPAKRQYVLDVTRPGKAEPGGKAMVKVRAFRMAATFSAGKLTYRRGDVAFERDFYNEFLVNPEAMITAEAEQWLAASGAFTHVIGANSRLTAPRVLEGNVTALYGDFTEAGAPAAVMEIQLALINDGGRTPVVTFHQTYRKTTPLANASAPALIRGFNACLAAILTDLETDLRRSAPRAP